MERELNDFEKHVILEKGTELPFSGEYCYNKRRGTYVCRQCGKPLYSSEHKFESSCGWPSFDDEFPGAVNRSADADGIRTEITCAGCGGHLGHLFTGEGHTHKNLRHCVNSVSMRFIPGEDDQTEECQIKLGTALFAGGSFWGLEYLMRMELGVLDAVAGYMGGHKRMPTYDEVCTGQTGHSETVKILFDPQVTSFENLAKAFFEVHDPTRHEDADETDQYGSRIFYVDEEQKATALELIAQLTERGYDIATQVRPADTFWRAEDNQQNYYARKGTCPYCHKRVKRF